MDKENTNLPPLRATLATPPAKGSSAETQHTIYRASLSLAPTSAAKLNRSTLPPAPVTSVRTCKKCNCCNSKCLKLYCDCFAAQQYCSGCSCRNCLNMPEFEEERQAAIKATVIRNPNAFKPKISIQSARRKHKRGCNCKKSGCLKKYCECFQNGVKCGSNCRCIQCKNQPDSRSMTGSQTVLTHSISSMMSVHPLLHQPTVAAARSSCTQSLSVHQLPVENNSSPLSGLLGPRVVDQFVKSLIVAAQGEQKKSDQEAAEDLLLLVSGGDEQRQSEPAAARPPKLARRRLPEPVSPLTSELRCDESEDAFAIPASSSTDSVFHSQLYQKQERAVIGQLDQFLQNVLAIVQRRDWPNKRG